MNILKHELKAGLKSFVFWVVGLFVLVFAGIIKFTGIDAGGIGINEIISQFPRPLQAMLGLVDVNISTLDGYYAIIVFYVMICISIYAISLGANAVGHEATDKTYEFVFTKPRSRTYILTMKLSAGGVFLGGFGLLNYIFSMSAVTLLKSGVNISREIQIASVTTLLIGFLFYTLSAWIVSLIKRSEKGFLYGNLCFVITFIISMIYEMLENAEILRVFTPLRYFTPAEILNGDLNSVYLCLTVILCVGFVMMTFINFKKKDLQVSN